MNFVFTNLSVYAASKYVNTEWSGVFNLWVKELTILYLNFLSFSKINYSDTLSICYDYISNYIKC